MSLSQFYKVMNSKKTMQGVSIMLLGFAAMFLLTDAAFAGSMPWDDGIQRIAQSLCGPTAKAIAVVALVAAGVSIGFGEVKGWLHHLLIVLIGVSIAVLAPRILSLFGVTVGFNCG